MIKITNSNCSEHTWLDRESQSASVTRVTVNTSVCLSHLLFISCLFYCYICKSLSLLLTTVFINITFLYHVFSTTVCYTVHCSSLQPSRVSFRYWFSRVVEMWRNLYHQVILLFSLSSYLVACTSKTTDKLLLTALFRNE